MYFYLQKIQTPCRTAAQAPTQSIAEGIGSVEPLSIWNGYLKISLVQLSHPYYLAGAVFVLNRNPPDVVANLLVGVWDCYPVD